MPDLMRAIILMILGMFFFTLADLFVKLATASVPSGEVVAFMGAGNMVLFYALLKLKGYQLFARSYWHYSVIIRTAGEVIAALSIISALKFASLSVVTAIMQSQPLLLTAAGAIFLGEKVGVRRIAAVFIGFLGVLLIIRPTMEGISFASLLVLLGVVGMAIRDVASRLVPSAVPTFVLGFWGGVAIFLAGLFLMAQSGEAVMPQGTAWLVIIGFIIFGTAGVVFVTNAMRLGEVTAVSPFRYVKIVFAIGVGVIFLGETVDVPTIAGTVIVVSAGLYTLLRERLLMKRAAQSATTPKG